MCSYSTQGQRIRSICRVRSLGTLEVWVFVAVLLGPFVLGFAHADDSMNRRVDHVYVRAGDIQYRLPELVAQLQVRAVLELGRLKEPRSGGRLEPTEDYPYYEPDLPPPEQTVKPFELLEGTVRDALDAYCTLNPHLEWRVTGGTVWLRRTSGGAPMLEKLLAFRLDEYPSSTQEFESTDGDTPPLSAHMYHLAQQVNSKVGRRVLGFMTNEPEGYKPGVSEIFFSHEPVGDRAVFRREHATVMEILLEMIQPFPNLVAQLSGDNQTCGVSFSTWSRTRRQLNLKELALAYTLQPKPLFGCTNVTARRDTALRELRRRHHFEPKKVVDTLIEQGTIEALVRPLRPGETHPPTSQTLVGLFQMNDPVLSKHAAEVILSLPDPVARYYYVGDSIPRPYQPGFNLVLPVWKELVHDENPSTRALAQMILDWHKKRPTRLKSVEETAGGGL